MADVERGICESLIESGFAQQDGDIDGGTPLIGGAVLRATRAHDIDAELAEQAALDVVAASEGDQEAIGATLDAIRRRCAELGLVDLG
jgi:hypothetical protein